ncbi:MAG: hypothetical protein A2Z43_05320 [Syntrophobacterales bacterium RBG_19FT_COMBO_59_10]|nr:MAG: hypothetical protein A2Z43_05320 [Syntrophobacterales bacterium RBG_19FT_COMBO_59_10]
MQRLQRFRLSVFTAVVFLIFTLGCSAAPKVLDRSLSGPQLVMNPQVIPLGVAKLMDTNIVFEGSGFKPGDSVFVSLIGKNDVNTSLVLAKVEQDGTFRAEVGQSSLAKLAKITGILRANVRTNEKFDSVVVLTGPTIPAGAYTARATSLLSPLTAEIPVTVAAPTFLNRIVDGIGGILGKIDDKR